SQVVPRPGHALLKIAAEMCVSAGDRIVIGQASSSARCQVRLVEPSDAIEWIGAQPRHRQHVVIQVRGIDAASAEHTLVRARHRRRQAAPDWSEGIFAEVVAVTEADALEQKADLDVLELSPRSL